MCDGKKFKVTCFKGKTFVKLLVNDMDLRAFREPVGDRWDVEIYHDKKLVQVKKHVSTLELKNYFNAYLTIARNKSKVLMG